MVCRVTSWLLGQPQRTACLCLEFRSLVLTVMVSMLVEGEVFLTKNSVMWDNYLEFMYGETERYGSVF